MQKTILAVTILLALFLSHMVLPGANSIVYKVILMALMTIGFLWPIALLFTLKVLISNKNKVTFKKKAIMTALCILTVPLVSLAYLPPEGIFLFNPEIDTKYTEGFSQSKFNQIHQGQKQNQVVDILGEPFNKINIDYKDKYNEIWLYSTDGAFTWDDFAWKRKQVHFKNKLVVETHTGWSYD